METLLSIMRSLKDRQDFRMPQQTPHSNLNASLYRIELERRLRDAHEGITPNLNYRWAKSCEVADIYHRNILNPDHPLYRRGTVIIVNDTVAGHVKLKGDRSFLSWQTMSNNSLYSIFGGIYQIPEKTMLQIEQQGELSQGEWGILHVPELPLNPLRFAMETKIFTYSLRELIRRERKRFETI